nr:MAG TPA: hypothetical protein [Caudoviricetes sp.]
MRGGYILVVCNKCILRKTDSLVLTARQSRIILQS